MTACAPPGDVTVRRARDAGEIEQAIALRTAVFVGEQGVAPEEEIDGRDGEALHLVASAGDGPIVGTCRLLADGERVKLGRMAVARERRGAGHRPAAARGRRPRGRCAGRRGGSFSAPS